MKKKNRKVPPQLIIVIALLVLVFFGGLFFAVKNYWPDQEPDIIKVKLYYYNQLKDKEDTFAWETVLPVERKIQRTKTPLKDTVELLIKGDLTLAEKKAGFSTEFPHPQFKLLALNLKDGALTLRFTVVPSFTDGGSSRIGLLVASIVKTAKQFPQVKEVIFEPEELFQP